MHRLHVKIFLWFWLGVLVVSGTLVTLTELTHSRADDDRAWEEKYTPRVDMWARQESQILRREGRRRARTLRRVVRDGSRRGELHLRRRRQGSARPQAGAGRGRRLVQSMADWPAGAPRVDAAERIIAERVVDARGASHVVVVDCPSPSVLKRSLFEFLSPDHYAEGPKRRSTGLIAVLVVAGVFCFMLARHIAKPIDRLRAAARHIANEQLQTRVDGSVLERKDELADLGRDFDRMAERIEDLVTAQRHLLADVARPADSPLARLNCRAQAWRGSAAERRDRSTSIASRPRRIGSTS